MFVLALVHLLKVVGFFDLSKLIAARFNHIYL